MKAVIFAAGLGTRLRPITDKVPKPLIEVGGKPILQRTLESLPDVIDEVIVVVGYKKEMIIEMLERASSTMLQRRRIRFAEQRELRGTYDALRTALAVFKHLRDFDESFLVLNGDDLYAKDDLERLCAASPFAMLAHDVSGSGRYSHLTVEKGRLTSIVRAADHAGQSTLVYAGAALLDGSFFELSPAALPSGEHSLPHTLESNLNKHPVQIIEARFWMPVGTPEELAAATAAFAS